MNAACAPLIAPAATVASAAWGPAAARASSRAPTIAYDDFAKIDLRVGLVIAAEPVPKAKKLLKLTVDLGEARHRTIVAGIAEAFTAAALPGQRVLVVANLAPRELRGVTSEGMILAAGDDAILALGTITAAAPPGTRVK